MCGLAGIFDLTGGSGVDAGLLRRMTAAIAHRGPDGDGFYFADGVGLGHRRLAIIDPAGGEQPMFNEDGSVVIVFNGCIYNHVELNRELAALGHVFRSRCDTEVILHAWESWGPDCLQRFNGFFSLALWDSNRRQLFLARDRLGKKPLHYAVTAAGQFVFSSELGSFAHLPELRQRISATAIDDYFAFGYIPEPQTIFEDILHLPAAHFLVLEHGKQTVQPRRYWQVPTTTHQVGEAEAVAELTRRLTSSVGARLIADVPLGAFLSGGVDSSAVVALAAGQHSGPLDTFTIGFDGAEDETPYATMVAERYRTAQHSDTTSIDYIDAARDVAKIFGQPFGDSSAVPTWHVSALARRTATVALSGDGGDEVFGGYRRYRWHSMTEAVRAYIPGPLRRQVIGELARIYPKLDRAPRWLRAKHTLTELSLDAARGYASMVTKVQHGRRRALYSPALEARLDGHDPTQRIVALMDESGTEDALLQAQYADINSYLVGDIHAKVDRASMANSLEVRAPFLDYTLVEWGLGLPPALKLRGGEGKYVLKRALEPLLPRELIYRRKQGFAATLGAGFRAGIDRVRARLLGAPMLDAGLFSPGSIAQLIDEHAERRFDHGAVLWLLLVFEGFLAGEADARVEPLVAAAGTG